MYRPTISSDTGGTIFGFVGDGVQFGIDSNRPTGVISNVFIDANVADNNGDGRLDGAGTKKSQIFNPGWLTGLTLSSMLNGPKDHKPVSNFEDLAALIEDDDATAWEWPTGNSCRLNPLFCPVVLGEPLANRPITAFNSGDNLTVSFDVTNLPSGAKGVIYIVDPLPISGLASLTVRSSPSPSTFIDLLVEGTVRDSITVDSGLIDALAEASGDPKFIGNNRRITAAAFLEDRAGNLSAVGPDGPNSLNPQAKRDPNIHVLDLTPATISPVRPKTATGELPDSNRFTALTNGRRGPLHRQPDERYDFFERPVRSQSVRVLGR